MGYNGITVAGCDRDCCARERPLGSDAGRSPCAGPIRRVYASPDHSVAEGAGTMTLPVRNSRDAGFTLLETLGAIALMGVVLWSLSIISSQWLSSWRSSHDRLQRIEAIMMALDRIAADIGEAEFARVGNGSKLVVFEGHSSEVTFVRTAIGPNVSGGLELVRIGEAMAVRGEGVVRSGVVFVPGTLEVDPASSPVVLLRR